jgi:hypothetical protein
LRAARDHDGNRIKKHENQGEAGLIRVKAQSRNGVPQRKTP